MSREGIQKVCKGCGVRYRDYAGPAHAARRRFCTGSCAAAVLRLGKPAPPPRPERERIHGTHLVRVAGCAYCEREAAMRAEADAVPVRREPLPAWGTMPKCPKGVSVAVPVAPAPRGMRYDAIHVLGHSWPLERTCRGFTSTGCVGIGPHAHRSCPQHGTETIEAVPRG